MIVLGIETSCDETAVSICKDGSILSNVISSQEIHSEFGGVVPEIASREHEKMLNNITVKAIKDASIKIAIDSVKKIITTSVDKSKLNTVFHKNLDETKEELKKINS